jgi:hypothetical protein
LLNVAGAAVGGPASEFAAMAVVAQRWIYVIATAADSCIYVVGPVTS